MDSRQQDGLMPDSDSLWQAIDRCLAEVEQGLAWGDLVQARTALADLPGSLRMMGLAGPAGFAEQLWTGFQTDPRAEVRLSELASLQAALLQARQAMPEMPLSAAAAPARRVLVAAEGALTAPLRGLREQGWRFTVVTSPAAAAVWLRMDDVAAVLWDPADGRFPADWVAALPPQVTVLGLGSGPDHLALKALPAAITVEDLLKVLAAFPSPDVPQLG